MDWEKIAAWVASHAAVLAIGFGVGLLFGAPVLCAAL